MVLLSTEGVPAANRSRAHRRVPLRVAVDVWGDEHLFAAHTVNLGEGGLCLAAEDLVPVGALVELTLTLPGSAASHRIHGEIHWAAGSEKDGWRYGVRFIAMSAASARVVRALLDGR